MLNWTIRLVVGLRSQALCESNPTLEFALEKLMMYTPAVTNTDRFVIKRSDNRVAIRRW